MYVLCDRQGIKSDFNLCLCLSASLKLKTAVFNFIRMYLCIFDETIGNLNAKYEHVKKDVAACSQIKIMFGNNFVGILTPLVMMGLCIKWTVKLLLVTN